MALIKCPECDSQVSDKAQCCPNCGFPVKDMIEMERKATQESIRIKRKKVMGIALTIVVLCVVAAGVIAVIKRPDTSGLYNKIAWGSSEAQVKKEYPKGTDGKDDDKDNETYYLSIEGMVGVLPSVTSMGMASLLPHQEMNVDEHMNVTVDGLSCSDTLARDKILKAKNPDNIAIQFDEIAKANKPKVRELLQNKNIVYIYHNQVDARGDKPASENEVFNACEEAIEEIYRLIKKLTGDVTATKFIVTADHGFLYRRDKLQEFDKVSYDKEMCTYSNKRFLLTKQMVNAQGVVSRGLAYLNKLNTGYVAAPLGADIFKVPGGGQNFVHGGSSLQEMLVPVIEVKTAKGKQAYDFVDVILTSVSRKVTNLRTYFDFIQTEKVTDVMKGMNIIAYFESEDGEKISYDVPIIADSQSDAPEDRTFHEKFTFKSKKYLPQDKYYLVMVDANDTNNELHRYEFTVDIAFVDDFGF